MNLLVEPGSPRRFVLTETASEAAAEAATKSGSEHVRSIFVLFGSNCPSVMPSRRFFVLALSVPILLSSVFSTSCSFSLAIRLADEVEDESSLLLGRSVMGEMLASSKPRRTESCGWSQNLRGETPPPPAPSLLL